MIRGLGTLVDSEKRGLEKAVHCMLIKLATPRLNAYPEVGVLLVNATYRGMRRRDILKIVIWPCRRPRTRISAQQAAVFLSPNTMLTGDVLAALEESLAPV